jgi:protein-S-isoprenylcysteine O-methyltransferase Ste14
VSFAAVLVGVLRHALAIAVLPFTMAVLVPVWLARREDVRLTLATSASGLLLQVCGLVLLALGLVLFVASLRRFAVEGRGTLAPWDPPRELVVRGPYRYVRNPMISGVLLVLVGEALVLRSQPHLGWAAIFFAINATYIPLLEEPGLESRFGEPYREYCRHVPRLLPRLRPWRPTS